jgi:hypothetical protein
MDVVYLVAPGHANEALRHSLRSLRHLPHDRVWLAGFKPRWISPVVGHIPVPQERETRKHYNTWRNLRVACLDKRVSEDVILMNDDFFVTRHTTTIPVLHRGPLARAGDATRGVGSLSLAKRRQDTIDILGQLGVRSPLCYELHIPMVINREKMVHAMDEASLRRPTFSPPTGKRTVYANLWRLGGDQAADVKVSKPEVTGWETEYPFVSTSDAAFNYGKIGLWLRRLLADPGPYELGPQPGDVRLLPPSKPLKHQRVH